MAVWMPGSWPGRSLSSLERSTERPMPSELPGEDAQGALAVASNRPRPGAVLYPPHPAAPVQGRRSRGSRRSPASGEASPRSPSPGRQHALGPPQPGARGSAVPAARRGSVPVSARPDGSGS
jgi:hypothetical protein